MASSHRRLRDLYLQCTNKYRCWGTCIGWALRSVVVSQSAEICRDDLHVNSVCLWSRAISIYPTCSARVLCRQQNFYPLYNKFWRLKALLLLSGKFPCVEESGHCFFFLSSKTVKFPCALRMSVAIVKAFIAVRIIKPGRQFVQSPADFRRISIVKTYFWSNVLVFVTITFLTDLKFPYQCALSADGVRTNIRIWNPDESVRII